MRHVDEGLMHAWLDGGLQAIADAGELPDDLTIEDIRTHLQSCADCRALLEEERELRERAGLVLRDALPPRIEVPPFESVTPARPRRPILPLAWAASLLLAVGAGWWGSLLWRDEPQFAALQERAVQDRAALPMTESQQTARESLVQPQETSPAAGAAGVSRPQAAREAAPQVAAAPTGVDVADEVASASGLTAQLPPPAIAATEQSVRNDARSALAPSVARSGDQAAGVSSLAAPTAPVARDAEMPLQQVPFTAATAMFRENVRRARDDEFRWLTLSPDDQRRSGTPALIIADAGVPHIAAAATAVPSRLLRVHQTLAGGEPVELFVWSLPAVVQDVPAEPGAPPRMAQQQRRRGEAGATPLDIMPVSSTRLQSGAHEIVVFVPQYDALVSLSGRMGEEQLRTLAQRLTLAH
jgi:hypothetical protein